MASHELDPSRTQLNYLRNLSPSLSKSSCNREGNSKQRPCTSQLELMSCKTLRARAAHISWVSSHGNTSGAAARIFARNHETAVSCRSTSPRSGPAIDGTGHSCEEASWLAGWLWAYVSLGRRLPITHALCPNLAGHLAGRLPGTSFPTP